MKTVWRSGGHMGVAYSETTGHKSPRDTSFAEMGSHFPAGNVEGTR